MCSSWLHFHSALWVNGLWLSESRLIFSLILIHIAFFLPQLLHPCQHLRSLTKLLPLPEQWQEWEQWWEQGWCQQVWSLPLLFQPPTPTVKTHGWPSMRSSDPGVMAPSMNAAVLCHPVIITNYHSQQQHSLTPCLLPLLPLPTTTTPMAATMLAIYANGWCQMQNGAKWHPR